MLEGLSLQRLNIIVIDDDKFMLNIVTMTLEQLGALAVTHLQ